MEAILLVREIIEQIVLILDPEYKFPDYYSTFSRIVSSFPKTWYGDEFIASDPKVGIPFIKTGIYNEDL